MQPYCPGQFIQTLITERGGEGIPPDMRREVATTIKEKYCYVCSDIVKEFNKLVFMVEFKSVRTVLEQRIVVEQFCATDFQDVSQQMRLNLLGVFLKYNLSKLHKCNVEISN